MNIRAVVYLERERLFRIELSRITEENHRTRQAFG